MSQKTSKTLHKWVELFPDCSLHVRSLGAQTPAVDMIIPRTFGYCLVRLHLFRCAPIARPVTQILFAIGYQVQIRGKVSPIWQLRHHTWGLRRCWSFPVSLSSLENETKPAKQIFRKLWLNSRLTLQAGSLLSGTPSLGESRGLHSSKWDRFTLPHLPSIYLQRSWQNCVGAINLCSELVVMNSQWTCTAVSFEAESVMMQ